jgi:cell division protein FtsL
MDKLTYMLLVTWIVHGQPPSSYQTQYTSADKCIFARETVLADWRRLKAEHEQRVAAAAKAENVTVEALLMAEPPPMVSATCTAQ